MRTHRLMLLAILAAGLAALTACKEEPPATAPPRDSSIALDTPEDATRTLLTLIIESYQASARRDRAAVDAAREQIVWHVAAQDEIMQAYTSTPRPGGYDRIDILRELAKSWVAAIAYYADDIGLDSMALLRADADKGAVVLVPAHHGEQTATIRVALKRSSDDRWRAYALDFMPPSEATPIDTTLPAPTAS